MKIRTKVFSGILAGMMACNLAVPALAANEYKIIQDTDVTTGQYSGTTTVTSTMQAPTIKVTIPTTGSVVINPYGMKYRDSYNTVHTDQIISATYYIENASNVDLSVDVSAVGTAGYGSKATFASSPLKETEKNNALFMYVDFVNIASKYNSVTWPSAYSTSNKTQVVVSSTQAKAEDVLTLSAARSTYAPTYAAFRVTGEAAKSPEVPWGSTDNVTVKIAFTFNPTY